jgi:methyl-accepting chemotaxis protein
MAMLRVAQMEAAAASANSARYHSYLLADELRQSSDDLTRLARTYVVTADAAYEKEYMDILDVRNGKKPRASGATVALQALMKQAGFSEQEFGKLKEAEANSNDLVRTEVIAMNAVKGKFDDGKGGFTREDKPDPDMARRIMHDSAYHQNKAKITKPVNEFLRLLDERTGSAVTVAGAASSNAFWLAGAMLGLLIAASVSCLLVAYRYIRAGLETAIVSAECIAGGDLSSSIDTERQDEIGKLLQAIGHINDGMADMIGNIRGSTDQMTVASSEIASGNADLSARTESQASSLEETASAL